MLNFFILIMASVFVSSNVLAKDQTLTYEDLLQTLNSMDSVSQNDVYRLELSKLEGKKSRALNEGSADVFFKTLFEINDLILIKQKKLSDRDVLHYYNKHAVEILKLNPAYLKDYFDRYYYVLRDNKVGLNGSVGNDGFGLTRKFNDMGLLLQTESIAFSTYQNSPSDLKKYCAHKLNEYRLSKENIKYGFREVQRGLLYLCYESGSSKELEKFLLSEVLNDESMDMSSSAIKFISERSSLKSAQVFGLKGWKYLENIKVYDQNWNVIKDYTDKSRFKKNTHVIFESYLNYKRRLFLNYSHALQAVSLNKIEQFFINQIKLFQSRNDQVFMSGNKVNYQNLNEVRALLDYLEWLVKIKDYEKFEKFFEGYLRVFYSFVRESLLSSNEDIFDILIPIANRFIDLYVKKVELSRSSTDSLIAISKLVSWLKNSEQSLNALLYKAVHSTGSIEDKAMLQKVFSIEKRLESEKFFTQENVDEKWHKPNRYRMSLKKQLLVKFNQSIVQLLKRHSIHFIENNSLRKLPKGVLHLNYFYADEKKQVFLLAHNPDGRVDLVEISSFGQVIEFLRSGLGIKDEKLKKMSRLLLPENLDFKGIERLSISPVAEVSNLPFETLFYNDKFLIESFDVYYNASNRFDDIKLDLTSEDQVAIFANPDYQESSFPSSLNVISRSTGVTGDSVGSIRFEPLSETELEAEIIKMYLSEASNNINVYSSSLASEENFLNVKSPKVMHVATHGFSIALDQNKQIKPTSLPNSELYYVVNNPIEVSGLALSLANIFKSVNGDPRDGVIDYYELGSMDLTDTDLMVLSSCETGVGLVNDGYLYSGLRKALALSGVRHTVTTTQKIPNDDTVEFMEIFYQKLKNSSYIKAIAETKKEMIEKGKPKETWAPFLLSVN